MNKPDWKDAPEWANWLAMEPTGEWSWYEKEPTTSEYTDGWFHFYGNKCQPAYGNYPRKWRNSLEEKPK